MSRSNVRTPGAILLFKIARLPDVAAGHGPAVRKTGWRLPAPFRESSDRDSMSRSNVRTSGAILLFKIAWLPNVAAGHGPAVRLVLLVGLNSLAAVRLIHANWNSMFKWLVLSVLLVFSGVSSNAEIVLELYPKEKSGQPVYFIAQGEVVQTPKLLTRSSDEKVDRSSPESLFREFLAAGFKGDNERYKNLYVPGEKVEAYLAPNSAGRDLKAGLKAKLRYGDYLICIFELESGGQWPFVMKQVGTDYFFSEALSNTDPFYDLLRSSYFGSPQPEFSSRKKADLKGMLSVTVHPLGDQASKPGVNILYAGKEHKPATVVKGSVKRSEQNLKTPEGALAAAYSATIANDIEWYLSLVSPDEIDDDERYIGGNTIRRSVTISLKGISADLAGKTVAVEKEIRIGDYIFFLFADEKARAGDEQKYLAFKNVKGQWLLTDELNGNEFLNFFRKAEINSLAAFPRIFFSP